MNDVRPLDTAMSQYVLEEDYIAHDTVMSQYVLEEDYIAHDTVMPQGKDNDKENVKVKVNKKVTIKV